MVGIGLALWSGIRATARTLCIAGLISSLIAAVYAVVMTMLELNHLLPKGQETVPMWFARWMMLSVFSMLFGGITWGVCNWKAIRDGLRIIARA
jgi:uncharacterized membrane protein